MKEINIYEADDGTQFSDKIDCIEYELKRQLTHTSIRIYKNRKLMKDLLSPETHNDCTKVKIPDTRALRDIKQIRDFTGFYDGINSTGSWVYDNIAHKWAKTA